MPARAILTGFCLAVTVLFAVMLVEMMIPIGKKADFSLICSEYLSKMEYLNGLPETEKQQLRQKLEAAGFRGIVIAGTASAPKGSMLTLSVQVTCSRQDVVGLFIRNARETRMCYEKSTVARKIYN
ncbi:MAG TPA: hypothetical protein DD727_04360 [Clostridiales bacterium]|nr:hypothetical protein [Clostridiales bacterium]